MGFFTKALKNKWVKLGLGAAAAGTGLGLAGIGPMAGLLGGGTASSGLAGGLASALGPSAGTAALAGDAFMPAALGAGGGGAPGMGSLLGSKFASGAIGNTLGQMGKAQAAMGLLNPQSQQMAGMSAPPPSTAPVGNTILYPQQQPGAVGSPVGMDDPKMRELLALLLRGQGRA